MQYFNVLDRLVKYFQKEPYFVPLVIGTIAALLLLIGTIVFVKRKYFGFVFKSLRRNMIRTTLTGLATMVLVFVVTLVWTVLVFLDIAMADRSKDLKAIVTEKYQMMGAMPFSYSDRLGDEAKGLPEGMAATDKDLMTWGFYVGTLDIANMTMDNFVVAFVMRPRDLLTMMDDLETLDPAIVKKLEDKRDGILIGRTRLQKLNKRVGERFKVTSLPHNYQGIDLEFEIIGTFPPGRYDESAVFNVEYLHASLDDWKRKNGRPHPKADQTLNLYWLRLPTKEAFETVAGRVMAPGKFASPYVKMETASAGISAWLDGYKDLIWGVRWLLVPAIVVVMSVVVANAISISVRERRTEMAVLKVLGYTPGRVQALVIGEALLMGAGAGFVSGGLSYLLVTVLMDGIAFPVAFFPKFYIALDALWWGPMLGGLAALLGCLAPAWSARTIKVSQVFAKVG